MAVVARFSVTVPAPRASQTSETPVLAIAERSNATASATPQRRLTLAQAATAAAAPFYAVGPVQRTSRAQGTRALADVVQFSVPGSATRPRLLTWVRRVDAREEEPSSATERVRWVCAGRANRVQPCQSAPPSLVSPCTQTSTAMVTGMSLLPRVGATGSGQDWLTTYSIAVTTTLGRSPDRESITRHQTCVTVGTIIVAGVRTLLTMTATPIRTLAIRASGAISVAKRFLARLPRLNATGLEPINNVEISTIHSTSWEISQTAFTPLTATAIFFFNATNLEYQCRSDIDRRAENFMSARGLAFRGFCNDSDD